MRKRHDSTQLQRIKTAANADEMLSEREARIRAMMDRVAKEDPEGLDQTVRHSKAMKASRKKGKAT